MKESREDRQSDFFDTCGNCKTQYSCCFGTRPPITQNRRKIIEEHVKKSGLLTAKLFVDEEYVFPSETDEGFCIFHDRTTRKCRIHSVKPETCVAGPITFDINKKTGRIEWFIKMDKICALAGVVYRGEGLLQAHLENAKRELLRLVDELDSEELKAILKKDEPETFKIGEDRLDKNTSRKVLGDK